MVIHFRGHYHLEQLSCVAKIILLLLQNEWTQINYGKFCFALFLSIKLSLSMDFFLYKIITIFSMSNKDIIIDARIASH